VYPGSLGGAPELSASAHQERGLFITLCVYLYIVYELLDLLRARKQTKTAAAGGLPRLYTGGVGGAPPCPAASKVRDLFTRYRE